MSLRTMLGRFLGDVSIHAVHDNLALVSSLERPKSARYWVDGGRVLETPTKELREEPGPDATDRTKYDWEEFISPIAERLNRELARLRRAAESRARSKIIPGHRVPGVVASAT